MQEIIFAPGYFKNILKVEYEKATDEGNGFFHVITVHEKRFLLNKKQRFMLSGEKEAKDFIEFLKRKITSQSTDDISKLNENKGKTDERE